MKTIHLRLMAASLVKHEAANAGGSCLTCHEPHAADIKPQLRAASAALCLSCHSKPLQPTSWLVQDIKAWMASNPNLYGPLKQQDCVGCHQPDLVRVERTLSLTMGWQLSVPKLPNVEFWYRKASSEVTGGP